MPRVQRPRHEARDGSRARRPRPEQERRERRDRAWAKAIERAESWTGSRSTTSRASSASTSTAWKELPKKQRELLLLGSGEKRIVNWGKGSTGQDGVPACLRGRAEPAQAPLPADQVGVDAALVHAVPLGDRAAPRAGGGACGPRRARCSVGGRGAAELAASTIEETRAWLRALELGTNEKRIADEVLKEIDARLGFLADVGLDYLTLDRPGPSLSGGESQRIRLASQIGSELTGVIYVLDEPSIGLHQRDNGRLLATLKRLRDLGNTRARRRARRGDDRGRRLGGRLRPGRGRARRRDRGGGHAAADRALDALAHRRVPLGARAHRDADRAAARARARSCASRARASTT